MVIKDEQSSVARRLEMLGAKARPHSRREFLRSALAGGLAASFG